MRPTRSVLRPFGLCLAIFALSCGMADAQEKGEKRTTPRITPIPTGSNAVPVGPDTHTPATSDSVPLGTPVNPANEAERQAIKNQSAAARMAARGKGASPAASGVGCSRTTLSNTRKTPGEQPSTAVTVPGSGFTGSSASPATGSQLGNGVKTTADCV